MKSGSSLATIANAASSRRRRTSGYTILELAVVIVIIGIMAATTLMEMDGITPKYRLRSSAREIGTRINWARSIAGGTGTSFHLHYDLDEGRVWLIHPPKPDEPEDLPLDQRHVSNRFQAPQGVKITEVLFSNGDRASDGEVDLEFDPFGHHGTHIVILENSEGGVMSVKFNSILGFVGYTPAATEFEVLR